MFRTEDRMLCGMTLRLEARRSGDECGAKDRGYSVSIVVSMHESRDQTEW